MTVCMHMREVQLGLKCTVYLGLFLQEPLRKKQEHKPVDFLCTCLCNSQLLKPCNVQSLKEVT